jgi:hypothetical protein
MNIWKVKGEKSWCVQAIYSPAGFLYKGVFLGVKESVDAICKSLVSGYTITLLDSEEESYDTQEISILRDQKAVLKYENCQNGYFVGYFMQPERMKMVAPRNDLEAYSNIFNTYAEVPFLPEWIPYCIDYFEDEGVINPLKSIGVENEVVYIEPNDSDLQIAILNNIDRFFSIADQKNKVAV